jgi:hypothetical protein
MSMKMRSFGMAILLAAFFLAGGVTSVRADSIAPGAPAGPDPFTFNFDEQGNGYFSPSSGAPFGPLNGALAADPSNGGVLALTFMLPPGVTVGNGDVEVFDVVGSTTTLGDIIRFTDASGNLTGATADRVIFYSDADSTPSDTSIGDTGFPSNKGTGATATLTEVGPEGANGFTYNTPGGNTFNGTSDGTLPEPGSLFLLGSGLLGIVGFMRKKK